MYYYAVDRKVVKRKKVHAGRLGEVLYKYGYS